MSLSQLQETEGRTEEPGVLQSMGLQRVGHDLATEQQHPHSTLCSRYQVYDKETGWWDSCFPRASKFPDHWRICSFLRLENLSHGWQFRWPTCSRPRYATQHSLSSPPPARRHATSAGYSEGASWSWEILISSLCLLPPSLSPSLSTYLSIKHLESQAFRYQKAGNLGNT